jgi:pyridoxal phosphate enzyme (YggS family)
VAPHFSGEMDDRIEQPVYMPHLDIAQRYATIAADVAASARECGRSPDEVTLVTVTKTRTIAEIAQAVAAGAIHLGENYVQELLDKHDQSADTAEMPQAKWHFIGHLQRNKARSLVEFCHLIHSVDSIRLIRELDRQAERKQRVQAVLLQLDLAGEETKFGASPELLPELVEAVSETRSLDWQGFMCMAPFSDDPENARPYYARLAQIREQLAEQGVDRRHLRHLSMGMTSDYRVAIQEGATLVRIGQAIFGPRS